MRFRILALCLLLCTMWGISHIVAQDVDTSNIDDIQAVYAIKAANIVRPDLGRPDKWDFDGLFPTNRANLSCELNPGAPDLDRTVNPYRVELTYGGDIYIVIVTADGLTQLCDPKFGDAVTGPQKSYYVPPQPSGPLPPTSTPIVCQLVGGAQPALHRAPLPESPVIPGDVLVDGRAKPLGQTRGREWYQVASPAGEVGWVSSAEVAIENCGSLPFTSAVDTRYSGSTCYVTPFEEEANVRETFDTSAEIVSKIYVDEFWQVYAKTPNGHWFFISRGWVSDQGVRPVGDCSAVEVDNTLYPGMPTPTSTPTIDPNFVPTATPTLFLGTPLAQNYVCPPNFAEYLAPRLKVGIQTASVAAGTRSNRLRAEPNTASAMVGEALPEAVLDRVITGPACGEGYVWWLVEIGGVQGWTVESDASDDAYFLEPQIGITATPAPSATLDPNIPTATATVFGGTPLAPEYMCAPGLPGLLTPRLVIGKQTARVVPGGPDSRLRSQPNSGTTLLGQVPESTVLDVLAGPACGPKSDVWWLVEVNGIQAWTAESRGTTYYVEPMPGFMPTQPPTATATLDPSLPSPTPIPPTATPTLFLGTPLAQEAVCPPDFAGYTPPRIKVGIQTASVVAGRTNNRVRSEPNTNGTVLTEATPETVFDRVLAGPACGEGYVWWLVEVNGVQGWTAESSPDGYFLEAQPGITATSSPAPSPTLTLLAVTSSATLTPSITPTLFLGTPLPEVYICPTEFTDDLLPRLVVGAETARVTEGGSGNRIRNNPSRSGTQIGRAEPGQVVDRVLAGPACGEGYVWWLVEVDGLQGWTAESDGEDYYLEPLITPTPVASPTLTPAG